MLFHAKTDYEDQLHNIQMNFNHTMRNTVRNIVGDSQMMWTKHVRRRKRMFTRREARKRSIQNYDVMDLANKIKNGDQGQGLSSKLTVNAT